jgi:hypothetical protein
MKSEFIFKTPAKQPALLYLIITISTLLFAAGCKKEPPNPVLTVATIATGLNNPIGLEMDKQGRVWVAEAGTGKNDGKVSVILPDGTKKEVITNFESTAFEGEADGPSHILFADGMLYILGTGAKMYKAVESTLKPGSPIKASTLAVEDIGSFVLAQKYPTNESHPYNLVAGPQGAIYITDAGANAIIRRDKNGMLSVFAQIPGTPNPTPVGPPVIESVPTGIYYDGENFLVTTLTGFPFLKGQASIYKVTPSGAVSVYQKGFTTLVDIEKGGTMGKVVLEHAQFGQTGFVPFSGRLVWASGTGSTAIAEGLNRPAAVKQANDHTWYVTSLGSNSLLKITN